MYNIAYSNLHNRANAEDAVHEAILRAINQIYKISQISSDKQCTYLNVIVRNISFDMFNKRVNNLSLEEDAEIYDQTAYGIRVLRQRLAQHYGGELCQQYRLYLTRRLRRSGKL